MKVSVLINNHNYAGFLTEAVEAALRQTSPPAEIIVVDDGSTDGSLAIARQLAATHPAIIKVIAQENRGQLSAMIAGIRAASSDWCAFLDADDTWQPDHLASAERALARHPDIDVHYTCHRETTGPPRFRSKWSPGILGPCGALVFASGCRIGTITSTFVLRTEIAKAIAQSLVGLEDDWRTRADDCLLFGAAIVGAKFHYDASPTVNYRIHGNNHFAGLGRRKMNRNTMRGNEFCSTDSRKALASGPANLPIGYSPNPTSRETADMRGSAGGSSATSKNNPPSR